MKRLEQAVGYTFHDPSLLQTALTHSSFAHEKKTPQACNERLEFLGDAVLSVVVSDYLYRHFPDLPEGELTRIRAASVCEKALHGFALAIGLGEHLLLSRGEQNTGGRTRPSILADAFEALIAAIYLDGGLEPARAFILRQVVPTLSGHRTTAFKDYKTMLQEVIQQNPEDRLTYLLVEESGPDHDKQFVYEVRINANPVGVGSGRSKKEAEQAAAREALRLMGLVEGPPTP